MKIGKYWLRFRQKIRKILDYKKLSFNSRKLSKTKGNDLIAKFLISPDPILITRFGSTELSCIIHYINSKKEEITWPEYYRNIISINSGFYPTEPYMLNKFCELYLDVINDIDILGVWNIGEEKLTKRYSKKTLFVPLISIEPYYFDNPWSESLQNKKVLVIHPFEKSIQQQYTKREYLFNNKRILPDFELITLKAVQSLGANNPEFNSWFDAYHYMCEQIKNIEFDIALIGAGAYGMPLASYVKSLGKKAIHLGGALQLLFGIKGRRWDEMPEINELYNDYWTRPLEDEKPITFENVENGCYW